MKSNKGKGLIGLIIALALVGLFGYFGYTTMNDIKLGLDLAGGVSITYQAKEENPTAEDMSDTIYKLQQRLRSIRKAATVSTSIFQAYRMPTRSWKSWASQVP